MFSSVKSGIERFLNKEEHFTNSDVANFIAALIIIIVWLAVLLLLSKWLWNEILCKIVSFTKPVTSVFQILGLVVLLQIIHPS
jgi:hypothetical protein